MLRLRLGIILIIISWLPIAQIGILIAHDNGMLNGDKQSSEFRFAVWTAQVLIGLIGLWLVGKLAVSEARRAGWKHTPRRLYKLFLHGPTD